MKKFLSLLLALAMVLAMTACAKEADRPTTVLAETEDAYYPLTVTDQAGREVTIASEPQSIVSGYYISSSLLIALGQADKLVGIEAKADKRPIYALSAPALLELPSVGSAKAFDLEGCAALEPDLVILPMKLKEAAETLTGLGIPTLLVNPENEALLLETNSLIGQALNCIDASVALEAHILGIRRELEELLAAKNEEVPTVYMGSNASFLATAGGRMYQSDLIGLAGGHNVAADLEDSYWAETSYEQILAWNPDYIFLPAEASYSPGDVLSDQNLVGVTAVSEGRVYKMPSHAEAWDSPVPGSILGAVWMASRIHPEQVSEEVCNKLIGDFYETFYGFDYGKA